MALKAPRRDGFILPLPEVLQWKEVKLGAVGRAGQTGGTVNDQCFSSTYRDTQTLKYKELLSFYTEHFGNNYLNMRAKIP